MTNTTPSYWDVDGVSLQTYAWNIVTLGGDRLSPPPLRGEDETIPYRPGETFNEKVVDSKVIQLAMWVAGTNEDGTIPTTPGPRQKFMDNWRMLRKLLWNPRRQFTFTKRFWVLEEELVAGGVVVDDLPRQGVYRLLTASTKGQFAGGLEPQMNGAGHGAFVVNIKLTNPYWYSDPIEIDFAMMGVSTQEVTILGEDRTYAIGIEFVGPLTAPRITNGDVWVRYNTGLLTDVKATLDVWDFQARHDVDSEEDSYKSAGYVQHDGDPFWLYLDPGEQEIVLTATGGTGTAKLTYQPGWL